MNLVKIILFLFTLSLAQVGAAKDPVKESGQAKDQVQESSVVPDPRIDQYVGNRIKSWLESFHYRKIKINDQLSKEAFTEFLKKVDFGKQFLLKEDVNQLSKYKLQLDDELVSGKHILVDEAKKIFEKRVGEAEKAREKVFKGTFDFTKTEDIELDPDKRDFLATSAEFDDYWRKVFKHSTLTRYLALKEEQTALKKESEDPKKAKAAKAKSKQKIMTEEEMLKEAIESTSKRYARYFERELKEDRVDYQEKFYNSITTIFDPHTVYFPPKRKEDFDIDLSGALEGIGAVLQEEDGYIKVNKIVTGGAAWRQKELKVDDKIIGVSEEDGEEVDVKGMRVEDAVRYIRGKKGSTVVLRVLRVDGTIRPISIVRDVVKVGDSFAKSSVLQMKGLEMKVGYIYLPKFYRDFNGGERNCTDDVLEEVQRLKEQKVDAIVLDLRNNGGGALEDARKMSGLFIKTGPIVQVRNHEGKTEILADTDPGVEFDGPLVVMVNRFSASASEILAAALQDYGRALIVGGQYSHGKGTVQVVMDLNHGLFNLFGPGNDLGAMKVTVQKFYRINGDSTQYRGVTPDVILPDPFSYIENREQDLEHSLKWDQVKPLAYSPWSNMTLDYTKIKKRSQERITQNPRYQKLIKNVDFLTKRKDDTKASLKMTDVIAENERNKKMADELNYDTENSNLVVSNYEQSLKSHETVRPGDEKHWAEEFGQRKEEWVKDLQKDVGLEETMYIVADYIGRNFKVTNLADGGSQIEALKP